MVSQKPFDQLRYLFYELKILVHKQWWRWLTCWWGGSAGVILSYRLDRFFFLVFREAWGIGRVFVFPVFLFLRILGANHQIHYRADIGPGLKILHPVLGIVISGYTKAGKNLTLTGGNCIGGRKPLKQGDICIGDNISMGANAVILGPLTLGNNITIGAGAVVVSSFPDDVVLIGIPAKAHI